MTASEKSGEKMAWTAVPPSDADFNGPPPYDVVEFSLIIENVKTIIYNMRLYMEAFEIVLL